MRFSTSYQQYLKFLKKINFGGLKSIFFILSLSYFCIYFFDNFDQISFDVNLERNGINLFLSFLFCILSIYLNAYAWKYIVKWFGKEFKSNNLDSLSLKIEYIKNNYDEASLVAKNAKGFILSNYSEDNFKFSFKKLFDTV